MQEVQAEFGRLNGLIKRGASRCAIEPEWKLRVRSFTIAPIWSDLVDRFGTSLDLALTRSSEPRLEQLLLGALTFPLLEIKQYGFNKQLRHMFRTPVAKDNRSLSSLWSLDS